MTPTTPQAINPADLMALVRAIESFPAHAEAQLAALINPNPDKDALQFAGALLAGTQPHSIIPARLRELSAALAAIAGAIDVLADCPEISGAGDGSDRWHLLASVLATLCPALPRLRVPSVPGPVAPKPTATPATLRSEPAKRGPKPRPAQAPPSVLRDTPTLTEPQE